MATTEPTTEETFEERSRRVYQEHEASIAIHKELMKKWQERSNPAATAAVPPAQERNNPFTDGSTVDNLGAGGRDVPAGQEDSYRDRLAQARQGATPVSPERPTASSPVQGGGSAGGQGESYRDRIQRLREGIKPINPLSKEETMKMNDEVNGWKAESRAARQMEKIRQRRREQMVKAGVEAEGRIAGVKQYKRIKNIIRIIKLVSAAGSSMGDIVISAGTFILTAHGELAYAKYINPKYPIEKWEKWLVGGVDLIILVNLLIVAVILIIAYQMIENPAGALQFIS